MPELKSARRSSWYRAKEYLARAARTFAGVVEEVWDILKRKKRSRGKTRGKKGGTLFIRRMGLQAAKRLRPSRRDYRTDT